MYLGENLAHNKQLKRYVIVIRVHIFLHPPPNYQPTDQTGKTHESTQQPKRNRPLGNTSSLWIPGLEIREERWQGIGGIQMGQDWRMGKN